MKRIISYFIIIILSLSCRQQYEITSIIGSYGGVEGGKKHRHSLPIFVSLELNRDQTFSLRKRFDLTEFSGEGEWEMIKAGEIEIICHYNPVVDEALQAVMSGGFIEDTLTIKVLSKNKLKLGDTVLKRRD